METELRAIEPKNQIVMADVGPIDTSDYCEFELAHGGRRIQLKGNQAWIDAKLELLEPVLRAISRERLDVETDDQARPAVFSTNESPCDTTKIRETYGLDPNLVDEVFDLSSPKVELILPDLPGSNKKEKIAAAYLLMGLGTTLKGAAQFPDDDARAVCQVYSIYDPSNHSAYLKDLRDCLLGSKTNGWRLTKPGIRRAIEAAKAGAALKTQ